MAETTGSVGAGYEQPAPADDPAALEAQIEQTRREMGETIDAIQARLDPELLKFKAEQRVEQAVDRAKDEVYDATIGRVEEATGRATRTVTDWRDNVIETIKDNPIPAALVGIGLGWLIMESSSSAEQRGRRERRYRSGNGYERGRYALPDARSRYGGAQARHRYYDDGGLREERGTVERTVDRAQQSARRTVDQAQETWEDVSSSVRDRIEQLRQDAGDLEDEARGKLDMLIDELEQMVDDAEMNARRLGQKTQVQARRARNNLQMTFEENPLALGAVALAIGAAVGLAAPRTEMEDELMGSYRDQLVERAEETAKRAKGQAEEVASEVTGAAREAFEDVKQEAKQAAKQVAETTKSEAEHHSGSAGESHTVREAGQAIEEVVDQTRRAAGEVKGELRNAARDVQEEADNAGRSLGDS